MPEIGFAKKLITATENAQRELSANTEAQAIEFLQSAGILNSDGNLVPELRTPDTQEIAANPNEERSN